MLLNEFDERTKVQTGSLPSGLSWYFGVAELAPVPHRTEALRTVAPIQRGGRVQLPAATCFLPIEEQLRGC